VLDTYFRSPKLKLLLTADTGHWGSPPNRTSFVFDSMLRLAYFLGNYYPKGGSQVFADGLASRFEEMGGHILMSSLVTHIHVRNQRACGLEIETGIESHRKRINVHAGVVISNSDLLHTLENMIGSDLVDPDYLASVRKLRPTLPCFVTHIGLQGVPTKLLEEVQGYYWSSWDANDIATNAFKIFVPTLFDREIAPPEKHIIIVQKITDIDYSTIVNWTEHKASVEHQITANLERIVPDFSDHVVVKLSASALTSHRYTLNHHGAMLGWELAPDQLGVDRPDVIGPVENLYFVGHWTQPGGGITPVMVSAMRVAQLITAPHDSHVTLPPIPDTLAATATPIPV
jgi:prolycopene isomerase